MTLSGTPGGNLGEFLVQVAQRGFRRRRLSKKPVLDKPGGLKVPIKRVITSTASLASLVM